MATEREMDLIAQRDALEISANRYRDIARNFRDDVHYFEEVLRKIIDASEAADPIRQIAQGALDRYEAEIGKTRSYTREELGRDRDRSRQ